MTIVVFLGSLLGAMAMRIPVAFALMLAGIALMIQLDSFDAQILSQNLISGADSFPLLAIPFFMLAGELMNAGGMSRRIVALADGAGSATSAAGSATSRSSPPW
jgi:TRAP-type transport system large permease protein